MSSAGEHRGSDPRRLDRLVLEAAALDAAGRAELLAAAAAEDAALAAEARRRLEAAGALGDDFLAPPSTRFLGDAVAATGDGAADEPAAPPAGDERWEIGELLGRGGMASVYRAFDRRLDRPVALKLLDADDPRTPERLLAEARAQARVRHPHVLDVYETGTLAGRPYIAMRYVAGGTLADLGDGVSVEQRVRLVAEAAEGLHAAHREGLLHGDVKPSNVLVEETADGEPTAWIGDFGIATELAAEGAPAALHAGTPQYMAPELLRQPGRAGDRRSDVFSLGVTLLQALTGERPVRGDDWR
ncbi:MAG TPA: serine/threonine-protein kinase, partial [Thermoanaerobaculia bacterium]|nr:serine/threonine-protein kinase [Thermoanaerobaculia bacterium]